MNLPKLAVLDIAGTTVVDPDAVGQCVQGALRDYGIDCSRDEANSIMGIPKPVALRMLIERAGRKDLLAKADEVYENFARRMSRFYEEADQIEPTPGTPEALRMLRKNGIVVYLDTGFSRAITDVILRRLDWQGDVIDGSVTADEVKNGRPHPDLIYRAMELAGVDSAKDVLKVGDTPSDMQEGTAAGCGWVVGVTEGTHTREELEPHPHTHLVARVADVPKIIGLT